MANVILPNEVLLVLGALAFLLLVLIFGMVAYLFYRYTKNSSRLKTNQIDVLTEEKVHYPLAFENIEKGLEAQDKPSKVTNVGFGTFQQVAFLAMENLLHHLYNVRVKLEAEHSPFRSSRELPSVAHGTNEEVQRNLHIRLGMALVETSSQYQIMSDLINRLQNVNKVSEVLNILREAMNTAQDVVKRHNLADNITTGFLPKGAHGGLMHLVTKDKTGNLEFTWAKGGLLSTDFTEAVQEMVQVLRDDTRQPTQDEYLALQFAYWKITNGQIPLKFQTNARFLGTPGFRRYTQTYMSLTDPGDGHVMGTTKRNDWMKGAIIHVEHLERPYHQPRMKIESYRIPSLQDFARVRLHVDGVAPTTSFMGRRVYDSDDKEFHRDFIKVVHLTAAACTAIFSMGAAECKIAMEGLTTTEAVRYMRGLRGQVLKNRKQYLSAAWNLNQTIIDDYEQNPPDVLTKRDDIARRAIEITCQGGFEKVTWDGASDTYPSQCIMYQLSEEMALTLVHEAHEKGLLTYFSSGFRFAEIPLAVYSGVDGVGIGGAQILRFMDKDTGMHGPYMEENISKILEARDSAAASIRGRGAALLCRLDTMFFEGSITTKENEQRAYLFNALLEKDEGNIEKLIDELQHVLKKADDGEQPIMGTARRLLEATSPLLKEAAPCEQVWTSFLHRLQTYVDHANPAALSEEYLSEPWKTIRQNYRMSISKKTARQTSLLIGSKRFK